MAYHGKIIEAANTLDQPFTVDAVLKAAKMGINEATKRLVRDVLRDAGYRHVRLGRQTKWLSPPILSSDEGQQVYRDASELLHGTADAMDPETINAAPSFSPSHT